MNLKTKKYIWPYTAGAVVLLGLFIVLALILYSHGTLFRAVNVFDREVNVEIGKWHSPSAGGALVAYMALFLTYLANTEVILAAELALILILMLINRRSLAAFFVGSLGIGELLSTVLKWFLARPRPPETLFIVTRNGYSFPSGHSLAAAVFYGFIGYCLFHIAKKRWQKILIFIATAILVLLIGFSRLYLGVHWASDVLGGWLLGTSVLLFVISAYWHIHRYEHRHKAEEIVAGRRALLIVSAVILIALGFFVGYFFVTHPLVVRSTNMSAIINSAI